MNNLRELALRARQLAEECPAAAVLSRDEFVRVCTKSASACRAIHDPVLREAALRKAVSVELRHAALSAVDSPRLAPDTPRSAQSGLTPVGAGCPSSASIPCDDASESPSATKMVKLATLRLVKPYLDPAFRAGSISRNEYTALALKLCEAFLERFPERVNGSLESSTGMGRVALSRDEQQWLSTMVARHVVYTDDVVPSPIAKEVLPEASESVPRVLKLSESPNTASPFETHLQKLREMASQIMGGSDGMRSASLVGRQHSDARNETDEARESLVGDIERIQRQLAALSHELSSKVNQLRALNAEHQTD